MGGGAGISGGGVEDGGNDVPSVGVVDGGGGARWLSGLRNLPFT